MPWSTYQSVYSNSRCLHQSIDGLLELAHFVSTFRIDKTFLLHHIQLFFKKSITCRIVGSGKPLRFEHWGAHEDLSLPSSLSQWSLGLARRTQGTSDTGVYTGSGHRCGVIPYSSVVWWIASRGYGLTSTKDEQASGGEVFPELVWCPTCSGFPSPFLVVAKYYI